MTDTLSKIWGATVEPAFDMLGLMDRPVLRFVVVSSGTAAALWYAKPDTLFFQGKARPWVLLSQDKGAIPLNAMGLSLLVGALSVLFV